MEMEMEMENEQQLLQMVNENEERNECYTKNLVKVVRKKIEQVSKYDTDVMHCNVTVAKYIKKTKLECIAA